MTLPILGVVVVTFNAKDVIFDCLESLLAAQNVVLKIIVVDNASTDTTVADINAWASGKSSYGVPADMPFPLCAIPKPLPLDGTSHASTGHRVTLIETGVNGGFAAGVNAGLAKLAADPSIDRFWVLNPDSAVPPQTPALFATHDAGDFSLMGGRVLYYDNPSIIQIDGGTINRRTGVTGNLGLFQKHADTPLAKFDQMDFITGASMIVSRAFYDAAGPMPEDYFLYYEEVDWALQRNARPLAYCPNAIVYHKAGAIIGSASHNRPASPFSLYFKHRARIRFMRRFFPKSVPTALAYSCAKATQLMLKGYPKEAGAIMRGSYGANPAPQIRAILSPEAAKLGLPRQNP